MRLPRFIIRLAYRDELASTFDCGQRGLIAYVKDDVESHDRWDEACKEHIARFGGGK